ncbi:MAG: 4Fe-4S binding protein [Candidatus Gastranaerophilales bacterium]|nr:4Fe-4S binding protein [Candidatus Gastranaerophilales bacterium]
MLKDILEKRQCFKLVCGAGNEDLKEIKHLVCLYSLAGCSFFDLCADEKVVLTAKEGLELSGIKDNRYLCVSIGIKGDPHMNKAFINNNCKSCNKCEEICPQKAISQNKIEQKKCIGCARCVSVCKNSAIDMVSNTKELSEILPSIIDLGIDCIEFHAISENEDEIYQKWNMINDLYKGMLSICVDRSNLSNKMLISRLKNMLSTRKPYSTIIQADGSPMSGGKDDFKTTLQAVATSEIVQNANLNTYLLLSGGTNSKTASLAKMCGINYHGISIGSYARKIVKEYIETDDFLENKIIFNKALKIAKELVHACLS